MLWTLSASVELHRWGGKDKDYLIIRAELCGRFSAALASSNRKVFYLQFSNSFFLLSFHSFTQHPLSAFLLVVRCFSNPSLSAFPPPFTGSLRWCWGQTKDNLHSQGTRTSKVPFFLLLFYLFFYFFYILFFNHSFHSILFFISFKYTA